MIRLDSGECFLSGIVSPDHDHRHGSLQAAKNYGYPADGVCTVCDSSEGLLNLRRKHRFPSAGEKELTEAGVPIGYGPSMAEPYRRATYFVDMIFKGATEHSTLRGRRTGCRGRSATKRGRSDGRKGCGVPRRGRTRLRP